MHPLLLTISILLMVLSTGCSSINQRSATTTANVALVTAELYATPLAAVIAASNQFNPISISEDREYMGAILREGDQYRYSVASGQRGTDKIQVKLAIPASMEVVAFWHTHGNEHFSRRYFSDTDSALVQQWHKPFYMAEASGILRVLQPDHHTLSANQAARLGLGRRSGFAEGQKVLSEALGLIRVATVQLAAI